MRHSLLVVTILVGWGCTNSPRPLHGPPPGLEKRRSAIDFRKAGDEAVEILQGYLRVDTVNPPGNESRGAQYLQDELLKDGIEAQVEEFAPGRSNLVARLPATRPSGQKPLCLLSHLDVVPAEAGAWPAESSPLSGALVDGMVWGRGALDMKGMGVLEMQVLRWLKRNQVPLHRDVILIAEADEEMGQLGMKYLTEKRWSELDCGQVINEGGLGIRGLMREGQTAFAISVGEKGVLWVRVVAKGEAGHGSTPIPERAPSRLVEALTRLAARKPTPHIHPATYEFLRRVGEKMGGLQGFVMQRPALVNVLAINTLLEKPNTRASITDTCQVSGFEGLGSAPNVIPSTTSAVLDCRVLPGHTPQSLLAELNEALSGLEGITLEVIRTLEPAVSEDDDALFDALARYAVAGREDAVAGPVISPGYTDSVLARFKGARAYGFIPFEVSAEELATLHGHNERVSVKNVHRGLEILYQAVVDVVAVP